MNALIGSVAALFVFFPWIIVSFMVWNVRKSKPYSLLLTLLDVSLFFLFLAVFFSIADVEVLTTFFETTSIILLLFFAVYHLKIEGFDARGDQ